MSSILPTPSATPLNSSGPCSSFKTVIGVAGKLTDLDIHVRDKFSSSCRAKENLKYHVDFGDGQATYDQALQWAKGGFKGKTQHTYQESNIYNAKLIIDNETTLRRSCANVDVLIQRDPPKNVQNYISKVLALRVLMCFLTIVLIFMKWRLSGPFGIQR